jgi:LPS-assembly protein
MDDGPRFAATARRARLLAGCAMGAWLAAAVCAHAQVAPAPGDEDQPVYLEADVITRDDDAGITTAKGSIEARQAGRTLRANEVVYDENTGVITAKGQVQIVNPDGTAEFADEVVLDDEMRAGVASAFSARLGQNIKLSAATAVKRNENVNELNKAIYTPCPVCAKDPNPTWSIEADRVTQDKKNKIVRYENARIRVKGVPFIYLPVFWHADPQADAKSGFLPPKFGVSDRRGVSYEQPYYWRISPSQDLTVSPQINGDVNPFVNLRYRKRFYSGMVDARLGYTHDRDFDGAGDRFGEKTSRSYILARGAFQATETWRWGFTAERTSDDLLFDKYDVGGVYETRGPFVADDRRLISQVYAIRQDQQSYFSAAAFSIQGLRPEDNDRTFPIAAPLVEARWEPKTAVAGGRLRQRGSGAVLLRDQSPITPLLRLPGLDSARATTEADWRSTYTSAAGLRVSPFLQARADVYRIDDAEPMGGEDRTTGRALAVAGADISWPFYRRFGSTNVVLEPVAQLAVSPNAKQIIVGRDATGEPIYLNEDSLAFDFDDTNLFAANKFPGFDLYEDGLRLNVGGRAFVDWGDGRHAYVLVGRSLRAQRNNDFPGRTGLQPPGSDWIVAADAQPLPGLSVFTRARLDGDTLDIRRAEAGANYSNTRFSGYFRYLTDNLDISGEKRENLDLGGELFVTKNWGVVAYGSRDLHGKAWIVRDIGVAYRDDCTRVDVIYRREDTILGRLGPNDSVLIRLTLATLGGPIYAN